MLRDRTGCAVDALLEVLMRPRIRVLRRWSFLVTLPLGVLVATLVDLRSGALVVAVRVVLWLAVALAAWRLGGERGEAVRDLLMHPRARRLVRAEADVVLALPRLAWTALVARPPRALRCSRGDPGPIIVAALAPSIVAEAALVHLLLPGDWLVVHLAAAALHAYALVWLLGWGLGSRAYPHRLSGNVLVVRGGPLFRVAVPLHAVRTAVARRERAGSSTGLDEGLVMRDGAALLPSRGRVDLWLELDRPVRVRRPFGEPPAVMRLAIASDDPEALARLVLAGAAVAPRPDGTALAALTAGGLGGLRDALQPA